MLVHFSCATVSTACLIQSKTFYWPHDSFKYREGVVVKWISWQSPCKRSRFKPCHNLKFLRLACLKFVSGDLWTHQASTIRIAQFDGPDMLVLTVQNCLIGRAEIPDGPSILAIISKTVGWLLWVFFYIILVVFCAWNRPICLFTTEAG